jgi:endonuclease/exonuclease/phosphatase family metal-dependent hydrolase
MRRFYMILGMLFFIVLIFGCSEKQSLDPVSDLSSANKAAQLAMDDEDRQTVKVMTWNIYVGTNVDVVLSVSDPNEVPVAVAAAYDTVYLTDFPARAMQIAKIIGKNQPHMIGLQEVSLIERYEPGNPDPVQSLNYLEILLNALAQQGLNYYLADSIHNADVTMPRFAGLDSNYVPIIDYVRLLDADAILVRSDVQISNPMKANYIAALPVPDLNISIPRGYVSVVATVEGKSYRFVNTHLEPFLEQVRLPQVHELYSVFAGETLPIFLVGDFNTLEPTGPSPYGDATYMFMTDTAGYKDSWVYNLRGNQGAGYTSPFSSDLMDPYPNLYDRIDYVFIGNYGLPAGRHLFGPVQAEVVGDRLKDRTPSGLWPSDHAGVVAKFHLKTESVRQIVEMSSAELVQE